MLSKRLHTLTAVITEKTKVDFKYLMNGSFWLNGNLVIVFIFGLILSVVLADNLTREQFGVYQYIISLGTLINCLCLTGMNTSLTQAVTRGFEGSIRASVKMQFVWGLIPLTVSLLWALYSFLHGDIVVGIGLIVIGITSPILNAFNTFNAILHGKKEFKTAFSYNAVISLFYYGSMFVGIYLLRNELFLATINLVVNALLTGALYVYTIKKFKPNNNTEPDTLDYGKKVSFLNTLNGVLGQVDNVFVFSLLGPSAFAVYNLVSNIPDKIGGIFRNLYSITLPRFSHRSPIELQKTFKRKVILTLLGSGLIMLVYVVAAPLCFKILFPKYTDGVLYSQIYSLSVVLGAGSMIASSMLVSQKNRKEFYIIEVSSPIVMTILQFIMVLLYGLMGIVVARVLGSAFKLLLSTVLVVKEKHIT